MKYDEFGNEIIDDEEIIDTNDNSDDNANDDSNDDDNSYDNANDDSNDDANSYDNDFSSDDDFIYERRTYRRANGPVSSYYDRPRYTKAKFSYNEVNKKEKKRYGAGVLIWSIIFAIFFGTLTGFGGAYLFNKANDAYNYMSSESNSNTQKITIDQPTEIVEAATKKAIPSVVGITTEVISRDFFGRQALGKGTGSGVIVNPDGYIITNAHVVNSEAKSNNNTFDDFPFGNNFPFGGSSSSNNQSKTDDEDNDIDNDDIDNDDDSTYDYNSKNKNNNTIKENNKGGKISVLLDDGSTHKAKIVWMDKEMDLAIIKINAKNLPVAELGDSDKVQIGQIAIAIGNPLGLDFNRTVTSGVISGKDRTIKVDNQVINNLIQTDASINPGNSGGPLLNSKGEVIGINTVKLTNAEGLGFSIPINMIKGVLNSIIKTGKAQTAQLGVSIYNAKDYETALRVKLSTNKGVIVLSVASGTAADKSGIVAGDIILNIDGKEVTDVNTLKSIMFGYNLGDEATLKINRNGKEMDVKIKFTNLNNN